MGFPASDLASDGVSGSESYERCKTFVTLSLSGHLLSTDSVHVVLCGLFIGRICRSHRTVCHRCKSGYSISNAGNVFDRLAVELRRGYPFNPGAAGLSTAFHKYASN